MRRTRITEWQGGQSTTNDWPHTTLIVLSHCKVSLRGKKRRMSGRYKPILVILFKIGSSYQKWWLAATASICCSFFFFCKNSCTHTIASKRNGKCQKRIDCCARDSIKFICGPRASESIDEDAACSVLLFNVARQILYILNNESASKVNRVRTQLNKVCCAIIIRINDHFCFYYFLKFKASGELPLLFHMMILHQLKPEAGIYMPNWRCFI